MDPAQGMVSVPFTTFAQTWDGAGFTVDSRNTPLNPLAGQLPLTALLLAGAGAARASLASGATRVGYRTRSEEDGDANYSAPTNTSGNPAYAPTPNLFQSLGNTLSGAFHAVVNTVRSWFGGSQPNNTPANNPVQSVIHAVSSWFGGGNTNTSTPPAPPPPPDPGVVLQSTVNTVESWLSGANSTTTSNNTPSSGIGNALQSVVKTVTQWITGTTPAQQGGTFGTAVSNAVGAVVDTIGKWFGGGSTSGEASQTTASPTSTSPSDANTAWPVTAIRNVISTLGQTLGLGADQRTYDEHTTRQQQPAEWCTE